MTVLFAATSAPKSLWYLTRGSGAVSLVLLTASIVFGILATMGWASERLPRFVVQGLHRNISLVVMIFLGLHIATAVADGFVPIRWIDAVLPFRSAYRPIWLGLGAVAVDLLIAVIVTSLVRVRLGYGTWRTIHLLTYACWPVALVHGLGTGSDTRTTWMLWLDGLCTAVVLLAVWWRLADRWAQRTRLHLAAAGLSVLAPAAIAGWLVVGPLHSGWGRTGSSVAATSADPAASTGPATGAPTGAPTGAATGLSGGFSDSFQGTVAEQAGATSGDVNVVLSAPLSVPSGVNLAIELQGRAVNDGVALSTGQVRVGPTTDPTQWQGPVSSLNGGSIAATLSDRAGRHLSVTITVRIDGTGTSMQGTLLAQAAPSGTN